MGMLEIWNLRIALYTGQRLFLALSSEFYSELDWK